MHIAGIVESSNTQDILDIIKYFLNLENRKVSISEYGYRFRARRPGAAIVQPSVRQEQKFLLSK